MTRTLPWETSATPNRSGPQQRDGDAKRKREPETIDLTGSDDENINKAQKTNRAPFLTPSSSGHRSGKPFQSSAPTPRGLTRTPSLNQASPPRSSQPTPSQGRQSGRTPSWNQSSSWSSGPARPVHSQAERDSWLAPSSTQDHEGDIYETIASSQNVAVGYEDFIKYSQTPSKIVGVQYYQGSCCSGSHQLNHAHMRQIGFATIKEQVELIREPGNPYDRNAIRVDNM